MARETLAEDVEAGIVQGGYAVVFEGTGLPDSNHKGIRTIVEYTSKADFDRRRAEGGTGGDIIVAEGISLDEAHRLAAEVSIGARMDALLLQIQENPDAAALYQANTAFALMMDARLRASYED
jgi:hypothetical protein